MKKIVLTFLFSIMISICASLSAQTGYRPFENSNDGFFDPNSNTLTYRSEDDNANQLPVLPRIGTTCNQRAPIGSGVLLLTGLGIGYLTLKKKKIENNKTKPKFIRLTNILKQLILKL